MWRTRVFSYSDDTRSEGTATGGDEAGGSQEAREAAEKHARVLFAEEVGLKQNQSVIYISN